MLFGVDVKNHKQTILKLGLLTYHLWKYFQDLPNFIRKKERKKRKEKRLSFLVFIIYYILDHILQV